VFYALGEASTAVRLGIVAVGANLVAALVMMAPLGHAGLAGASSVGAYVNLGALLWVARRRLGPLGGRALVASAARSLLASVPLIAWCALVVTVWPASRPLLVDVVWLGGAVVVGVGLFWGASVLLDLPERAALLRMLPRAGPRDSVGA
jgi:putative peptidoglycan lipid II flippase